MFCDNYERKPGGQRNETIEAYIEGYQLGYKDGQEAARACTLLDAYNNGKTEGYKQGFADYKQLSK